MQFGCWRGLSLSRPERGWHVEQSQFSLQVPWGRCLPWVSGTEENQNLSFSLARWQLSHTCGFHGGSLGISLLGITPLSLFKFTRRGLCELFVFRSLFLPPPPPATCAGVL